ncbi:hypothetical protein HYT01_04220 [Candidatus Giovannonibacteria bacterium]|nr:hypothetical protein [Candidatus Giovannonibacteria bacterium]
MPKLKLENALLKIKRVASSIENRFLDRYRRSLNLADFEDHLKLDSFYRRDREKERLGGISAYDVAFVLIRRYLERQDIFRSLGKRRREYFFDGLMGRVYYCPPPREYEFRARRLEKTKLDEFPPDMPTFISLVEAILKAQSRGRTENLSDWFANPVSDLLMSNKIKGGNPRELAAYWLTMAEYVKGHTQQYL